MAHYRARLAQLYNRLNGWCLLRAYFIARGIEFHSCEELEPHQAFEALAFLEALNRLQAVAVIAVTLVVVAWVDSVCFPALAANVRAERGSIVRDYRRTLPAVPADDDVRLRAGHRLR